MSAKLRFKYADRELEFEGSEEFLTNKILPLIEEAISAKPSAQLSSAAQSQSVQSESVNGLTTTSIAAKLNAQEGADLLIAAAARLSIFGKKATFTRAELLAEMQSASGYYKKSFSKNLSAYLGTVLGDQRLTETAKNVFSLSAKARTDLETKLANP